MKRVNQLLSVPVIFFLIIIQSCGSNQNTFHFNIPNDVSVVVKFNLVAMNEKTTLLDNIAISKVFASLGEDSEILTTIFTTGLDFNNPAIFFGKVDRDLSKSYWALAFAVKDAQNFEIALKENTENLKVKKKDKKKIVTFHEDAILIWDNEEALLLVSSDMGGKEALLKMSNKIYKNQTSLEESKARYQTLINKTYDIAYWMDIKSFMQNSKSEETNYWLNLIGLQEVYEKYSSSFTELSARANFENGELIVDTDFYIDDKKVKELKKLLDKKGVNQMLAQNIPVKNPLLLLSTSLNIQELSKNIVNTEDDSQNLLSTIINSNMIDILSGEVIFAVNDLNILGASKVDFVLGIGIKDTKKLHILLKLLEAVEGVEKKKGVYSTSLENIGIYLNNDIPIHIIPKKDMLFIVSNNESVKNIKQGKTTLTTEFIQALNENNLMLFLDINKVWKKTGFNNFIFKSIRKVNIESKNIQKNSINIKTNILFNKKSQNALTTLIDLAKTEKTSN